MTLTLWAVSGVALAGQPFALELRGGGSVLSGPEAFRVEYLGDNDSLGFALAPNGLPYDRWVTNGTKLLARWPVEARRLGLPSSARLLVSGSLGQNIVTPRTAHLETALELNGDRPYSGWLTASLGADLVLDAAPLAFARSGPAYTQLGVEVFGGASGPWSLAGAVQYNAHFSYLRLEGRPLPPVQGWGVIETAPGLSLDVSAYAETSLAAVEARGPGFLGFSGSRPGLHWLGGLRVDAGSMLRAAAVNTTVLAGLLGDPLARRGAAVPLALYVYLRGEARGVAWNGTIERPILDGTVVARAEPFVAEASAGAVVRVWKAEVAFSQTYRTNETASLPARFKTGQLIGQWSFTFTW